jgi:Ca2+-binding EF-hand superfamily protein
MRHTHLTLMLALTLLTLFSCVAERAAAPMDVTGETRTVWEYLLRKYDADGDGSIREAEYARGMDGFNRLDTNGDGLLSEADFLEDSSEAGSLSKAELRAVMAIMVYFQQGERAQVLTLEELESGLDDFDQDDNGVIHKGEFEVLAGERRDNLSDGGRLLATMLEDADPWQAMVEQLDQDDDGSLAQVEVLSFFREQAGGEDLWDFGGPGDEADEASMSGPAPGTVAPDFLLEPPEGGAAVRLSAYRGNRAVVLIFGSYT